jgi:hypothetical protein
MLRHLSGRDRKPCSVRRGSGPFAKAVRSRNTLALEQLEERVLPTIVFDPVFGAESTKTDGGYRLNSPPLYLIFWGSYWATAQGQPEATAIVGAAQNLVAGPYFSGLREYGADGKVTWGDFDHDYGDPPPNFGSGVLYNVVRNLADDPTSHIPRPTTPSHWPIYMVFTPPGTMSDQPGAAGYHTAQSRFRFDTDNGFQEDLFYFGWVSTDHNLDDATASLSHEIAETITDATAGGLPADFPFGSVPDGLHLNPGNTWSTSGNADPGDEISDREATSYYYRVNGVWVQSYWSDQKGGYRIYDGNQQTFSLHTKSDGSRDLDVVGDQRANPDDNILLTTDPQKDLVVVLNDETASFDTSYNIESVFVLSGGGSDTITVYGPPPWAAIYISSEGTASVNVERLYDGTGDAPVTVQSPLGHTSLAVTDRSPSSQPVSGVLLDADAIDGPGFGEVRFPSQFANTAPVDYLYTGIDGLTVTCPPDITLGGSGETDNILATGVPTRLITQSANPTVNVGNAGSVAAIQGALTIDDRLTPDVPAVPVNGIIVDDQADPVARTLNLGTVPINGESYGQAAFSGGIAPINYLYAATHSVTVITGTGSTTAYVAALGVQTNLIGHGVDTQVVVGNIAANGSVQDILFPLTISSPVHGTTITVNDASDPVFQTLTLDVAAIDGERYGRVNIPSAAPVYFKDGDTAGVTVDTGSAGAQVDVLATLAPTTLVAHGLNTTVKVSNAGHIGDDFENDLFITGPPNSVAVNVDASNDPGTLGAFVDRVDRADGTYGRIYNLAVGMIYYRYSDTSSLVLQTGDGDGPNPALVTVDATGVPTTLTGHGTTAVNVGRGSVEQIQGDVFINNVVAQTTVTVDDRNDTYNREYDLGSVTIINGDLYGRVTLFSGAHINYKYSDTDSMTLHTGRGGATVNVFATGAPTAVIGHAPATMISVSPLEFGSGQQQVKDIVAPLTLSSAEGSIQVAVDDFEDSQAEQITHDTVLIDGLPYGRISGLAPADILYQYARTDSVTVQTPYFGGTTNILATGAPLFLMSFEETVNVGNEGSVQDIRGDLRIRWGSNAGVLNIDDSADTEARTSTYDYSDDPILSGGDRITGLAPGAIIHRAGESATLRLGIGGGTFNLLSSTFPQTLALIDNGNTMVNIGNAGEIVGIFHPVNITAAAGITQLLVDNSAAPGGVVLDAASNQATLTIGSNTITFTGNTDSDVTVNVTGEVLINNTTPFKTTINASSGNGYNYLTVNGFSPNTQVIVNAGAGTNTLYGPNVPNTWHITGANSGDLGNGALQFNNYSSITAGSGDDYFYFLDGGSIAGELDGGGGTNTLDYSGWSGDVFFDPRIYQATGIGNLDSVQNAVGGKGSSILVGYGPGTNNVLKGGTGRNLLIAGFGLGATLIGNDDQDILIGGSTLYDSNPVALEAIMAEWARTDEDYNTRVANLLNGNGVPLLDNSTVFYNLGGNTLLGGAGPDLFFGRTATDQTNWDPNTEVFIEL